MDISVIVPLFNEEESITPMYDAITQALEPLKLKYEILFVDDGSSDSTFSMGKEIARKDPRLRMIKFRKNYGQTPAMAAGIDHAVGDILFTMDGDLQNDPSDIPFFLDKMAEGYDIVVGWRHKRKDKLVSRKIPSKIANWLIGKVTGVPIKDNGCSLKAYKASVIKSIPLYSEMHRFIPAMASLAGVRVAEIRVKHHARQFGESKYGLSRVFKVLSDLLMIKMIVSFSSRPMFWFAILAIPLMVFSMFVISVAMYDSFYSTVTLSLSMVGSGVLLGALSFFLIICGALSELIYKTRDKDVNKLPMLTLVTLDANAQNDPDVSTPGEG